MSTSNSLTFTQGPRVSSLVSKVNFSARNTEGLEPFVKSFSACPGFAVPSFPLTTLMGRLYAYPTEFPLSPAPPYQVGSTGQKKCHRDTGQRHFGKCLNSCQESGSVVLAQPLLVLTLHEVITNSSVGTSKEFPKVLQRVTLKQPWGCPGSLSMACRRAENSYTGDWQEQHQRGKWPSTGLAAACPEELHCWWHMGPGEEVGNGLLQCPNIPQEQRVITDGNVIKQSKADETNYGCCETCRCLIATNIMIFIKIKNKNITNMHAPSTLVYSPIYPNILSNPYPLWQIAFQLIFIAKYTDMKSAQSINVPFIG